MKINRRYWIAKVGIGLSGLALAPLASLAEDHQAVEPPTRNRVSEGDHPIILRSNENPYGPSPAARDAMNSALALCNRYHWDIAGQLIDRLSQKYGVNTDNILLGAGSTEILDLVARLSASKPGSYVIADPSYGYWTSTLDNLGMKKIRVPLDANRSIDLAAMLGAIASDTRLVYICNPNNPTGTLLARESLARFIGKVPASTVIVVDEAYLEYTEERSLTGMVGGRTNLLIARTFSKIHGLAGARIGYAVAHRELIDQLARMHSNTNNSVSLPSKVAAMASLEDDRFLSECYARNQKARDFTIAQLEEMGFTYIPSHANFVYFSTEKYLKDYFKQLKDHNIQGAGIYEQQGKWTRITIGTMEEMRQFISALS